MQFMPCVNRQIVNKFPFAYRPKASNYVVCHLFSLRSALGCCRRSSLPTASAMVWHDVALQLVVTKVINKNFRLKTLVSFNFP